MIVETTSPEETAALGRRIGAACSAGTLIALIGDLGAGKTRFVKGVAAGLGIPENEVTSPTFALVHVYDAPKSPVYHIDLFRLDSPRDLQNIGWDDIIQSDALVLLEWPDRAGDLLPSDHAPIQLRHVEGDPDRRILYAGGHLGHQTGER